MFRVVVTIALLCIALMGCAGETGPGGPQGEPGTQIATVATSLQGNVGPQGPQEAITESIGSAIAAPTDAPIATASPEPTPTPTSTPPTSTPPTPTQAALACTYVTMASRWETIRVDSELLPSNTEPYPSYARSYPGTGNPSYVVAKGEDGWIVLRGEPIRPGMVPTFAPNTTFVNYLSQVSSEHPTRQAAQAAADAHWCTGVST